MPGEWHLVDFRDTYEKPSRNGLTKPSRVRGSGTKFVNMKEIFAYDRMLNIDCERVPLTENEKQTSLLEPLDLLFARQSLVLEGAGKCSIFLGDEEPATFESHLIRVRINHQLADPYFLYSFFRSSQGRGCIYAITEQGAGAAGIRGSDLGLVQVPLPPLPEQKAIAHILSSLDDKIELNRRMNATLEGMAQALFQSWFVDFDPVIDNALAAGKEIPEEFKARAELRKALGEGRKPLPEGVRKLFPSEFTHTEEMGWIPRGWEVSTIGEEYNVVMGQSPKGDTYNEEGEGTLFYQGRAEFGWRFPTPRLYTTDPKRMAKAGDALMSVRAPVGDFNMALNDCCVGRGLCALRHKTSGASFTYYQMNDFRKHLEKFNGEGTVFGSINQKDLKALECLTSAKNVVNIFVEIVENIDFKILNNSNQIYTLTKLRDNLLPQLISGELRVGDAERIVRG